MFLTPNLKACLTNKLVYFHATRHSLHIYFIPYRFSVCNWHLPRGETCEVGPSKDCAVEDTIKYTGDEKNCQIQIERVQQDEDGNWQVHPFASF